MKDKDDNKSCNHDWIPSEINPENKWCAKCRSWLVKGIVVNRDNAVKAGKKLMEMLNERR